MLVANLTAMDPEPRHTLARAVIATLVNLGEVEVDSLLGAVGGRSTPARWEEQSFPFRRLHLSRLLDDLGDRELSALADALGVSVPPATPPVEEPSRAQQVIAPPPDVRSVADPLGPIFVVHGHDHTLLHLAVRVLERGTGRDVVVLHEQTNAGRTILEKFEDHAAAAAYAVVLLTPDDEGRIAGGRTIAAGGGRT